MSVLNIALLQIAGAGSLEANLKKGIAACQKAKQLGADLALFPEMWNNGYEQFAVSMETFKVEKITEFLQEKAVAENSEFVRTFADLARKLELAAAITFLEKSAGLPKNTVIVFDRKGKKILKYSKVHTVDFKTEHFTAAGDSFEVAELDYGHGRIKLGSMICFDRNFPEAARILMLNGAEVIIVPNACHIYDIHLVQLKTRAYENSVVAAMANYPVEAAAVNGGNGRSCAFSPIVRKTNGDNTAAEEIDPTIIEMGANEGIGIASVNVDALRACRALGYKAMLSENHNCIENFWMRKLRSLLFVNGREDKILLLIG